MKHRRFAVQLSASAGAVALVPLAAEAALITVTDRPVSIDLRAPSETFIAWDIDGDGTGEFGITRFGTEGFTRYRSGPPPFVYHKTYGRSEVIVFHRDENGGDVIDGGLGIQVIGNSFEISSHLDRYRWTEPNHAILRNFIRLYTWIFSTINTRHISYDGWAIRAQNLDANSLLDEAAGRNLIGFRFPAGVGEYYYGFASMNLDVTLGGENVIIESWVYSDVPGQAVHVNSIPAPPAGVSALTLLGLGAAGMRRWRQQKAAHMSAEPTASRPPELLPVEAGS